MPRLGRAEDRTLDTAMQQINIAIVNPWFFLSFRGEAQISDRRLSDANVA